MTEQINLVLFITLAIIILVGFITSGERVTFTITLSQNFMGEVKGTKLTLKNNNGNIFLKYNKKAKNNTVKFYRVVPGSYTLFITSRDFNSYTDKIVYVHKANNNINTLLLSKGPAGGYVFYDKGSFSDGWQYLEAAPEKYEFEASWGKKWLFSTKTTIGSGRTNTLRMIYGFQSRGINDSAAQKCSELYINGFPDWFLPSSEELNLMYQNLKLKGAHGFNGNNYWSSSVKADWSWCSMELYVISQNFDNGNMGRKRDIELVMSVRAIRAY